MDILDPGSEPVPSDAGPWAPTLEMIFATIQGPVPPAPMQLETARQARSLVEEIVLASLAEADSAAPWVAVVYPSSVAIMSGQRSLIAQLQLGSVVTLDMAVGNQAAWSIVWDSPGAAAESMLSGALSGGGSLPRPAVRIGVFQGDRRVAETSFDQAGGWQDDLDDRPLTDEVNRRVEEAAQAAQTPEEGGGVGVVAGAGASSAPGVSTPGPSGVSSGLSAGVLAGAAAAAGVAAAAIAREVAKRKAEPEPARTPPPPPVAPETPARQWYYMQGSVQQGPVAEGSIRELAAQGTVTAATLVWNESLPNWTTAAQAGLTPHPATPKPPPPPPVAPPPTAAAGKRVCPGCGADVKPGARFCRLCGHALS
jgi:hypothetical protein